VRAVEPAERPDAARLTLRHWGYNQCEEVVCVADRTLLVRRRPAGEGEAP